MRKMPGRHRTTPSTMLMMVVGLNVNVVTPASATPSSKLPVVVVCSLIGNLSEVGLIVLTRLAVDIWR